MSYSFRPLSGRRFEFEHRSLDAYRVAAEFVAFVDGMETRWFRGNCDRRRQLARAADSVALNIAEGSGRGGSQVRKNHYRIAMGSAGECDALLELLEVRRLPVSHGRELLSRIGAMLWRMT